MTLPCYATVWGPIYRSLNKYACVYRFLSRKLILGGFRVRTCSITWKQLTNFEKKTVLKVEFYYITHIYIYIYSWICEAIYYLNTFHWKKDDYWGSIFLERLFRLLKISIYIYIVRLTTLYYLLPEHSWIHIYIQEYLYSK